MECNKDEAARAKEIAEKKFSEREYAAAKKIALKALNLYPALEGLSQFLTTLDVYIGAENKINGKMDWYGILGVSTFADDEIVRKQYRKLALTLHPDKNKCLGSEGAFKLVSEAWSVLSDKVRKLAYNQSRSSERSQHNAASSNVFCNLNKSATSNVRTGNSNAQASSTSVPPPQNMAGTFWTTCGRCRTHYEYLRVYLNHALLCPNCKEAFVATEKGPPNVVKAPNWSSFKSTNLQSGPHSRTAAFVGANGPSSANVRQHAGEKREYKGTLPTAKRERDLMYKRSDGSFINVENPMKKIRKDDIRTHMVNLMTKGDGATSLGRIYESGKTNLGTERTHGFSGITSKHNSTRELMLPELRKLLIDKAQSEIRKKLQEWRSIARAKVTDMDKGNNRQKSNISDKRPDPEKHKGSTINSNRHVNSDSNPVTSNDTLKKKQTFVTINVPDSDFHDFDLDRAESSFQDDQVWAAYDDDDGMPRYYARIHKVITTKPFRIQFSWLNSRSNSELGPIDWVGSGFYKTCGDFRVGKYETTKLLNSFSHKVRWTKGNRGVVCIFPGKGEVWALYKNWSPDWNENTPDEVIHKYDMVEVLEDFQEEEGVPVIPLVKVDGYRTVFRRHNLDQVRKIPKVELFRFSHQVPNYLLTGQEGHNALKGCRELDPAATPLDLLQTLTDANETLDSVGKSKEDRLPSSPEKHASGRGENASEASRENMVDEDGKQKMDDR